MKMAPEASKTALDVPSSILLNSLSKRGPKTTDTEFCHAES